MTRRDVASENDSAIPATDANDPPILVSYVDASGRILCASERYSEWFGLPLDRIVGENFATIGDDPSFRALLSAKLRESLQGGRVAFETKLATASGNGRDIFVRFEPQVDRGATVGVFVIMGDRNERRKAEERRWWPEKMEALRQLTSNIVHDFNNILTVVKGHIELLDDVLPADPQIQALLAGAQRGVNRTEQFMTKLIDFSRSRQFVAEAVDIDIALRESIETVRGLFGEKIDIRFEPTATGLSCLMEKQKFDDAIVGLAAHAREAMAGGGTLDVKISTVEHSAVSGVGTAIDRVPYAKLELRHTGAVARDGNPFKVLEPIFTAKDSRQAGEVGLGSIYGFVRRSGGTIDVAFEPVSGMRFSIFLPSHVREESVHPEVRS